MKAESLSLGIVAIIKTEEIKINTGVDYINDYLKAKIKQLVVYRERTESILNSSKRTCFKI